MEVTKREVLGCPFCPFSNPDHFDLLFHVETAHPEDGRPSPFAVAGPHGIDSIDPIGPTEGAKGYTACECGEHFLQTEFESHLDMHYAEGMGLNENQATSSILTVLEPASQVRNGLSPEIAMNSNQSKENASIFKGVPLTGSAPSYIPRRDRRKSPKFVQELMEIFRHTAAPSSRNVSTLDERDAQRLGKKELGPHAHEERMPEWLRKQLEVGAKVTVFNEISLDGQLIRVETVANELRGVIPVIAQLCEQDHTLSRVYLCHPNVTHVVKMAKEGGFCGYRNIQMLVSYIRDAHSEGHERFSGRLPSIIQLQVLIENAWDQGFNSIGRIETGGIHGTRKYIGTPEAQALLQSLGISCKADAFNSGTPVSIQQELFGAIEQYFLQGRPDMSNRVCRTSLPPIYFQHPGHSLTIVGLEIGKHGSRNLLVLDPMFKPSPGIYRLIGSQFRAANPEKLLKAYRRGEAYLKYSSYEILRLTCQVPLKIGW